MGFIRATAYRILNDFPLPEVSDQSTYASERADARLSPATVEQAKSIAVGHQDIDPNCSGETAGYHGWLHRVKRQSSEATVADILALEGRYQETAQHLATEEGNHDTTKRLLVDSQTERSDLEQGCSDLARRAEEAEAVVDSLCNHDPDVVSALYFCSRKRKAAERQRDELAAIVRTLAACDNDSEKLFVPAELYQRLMRVAAELGAK